MPSARPVHPETTGADKRDEEGRTPTHSLPKIIISPFLDLIILSPPPNPLKQSSITIALTIALQESRCPVPPLPPPFPAYTPGLPPISTSHTSFGYRSCFWVQVFEVFVVVQVCCVVTIESGVFDVIARKIA